MNMIYDLYCVVKLLDLSYCDSNRCESNSYCAHLSMISLFPSAF